MTKFGQTIRNLYLSLRVPFAIILLFIAFVAGRFNIQIAKETALVAAALILLSLVFEIHKSVVTPERNRRFTRFHDAALEFRSKVEDAARKHKSVNIKCLGMGMDYGAPILDDLISHLRSEGRSKVINLDICMLDPKWERLPEINDTWPHKGNAAIQSLNSLRNRVRDDDKNAKVVLKVFLYRHMPNWHGFIVDDRYLYLGECCWGGGRLLGGENEYEFWDKLKSEDSREKVKKFLGWFEYCSKSPIEWEKYINLAAKNKTA